MSPPPRRVRRQIDAGRLSALVERPGIDPRLWVSLAVVQKFHVDATDGPFVDVLLLPSRLGDTARVGAEYAGSGFGLYLPLAVDDEVLVGAPSGSPDEGLVVLRRLWSAADPPPATAADKPADLLLQVKEDAHLRIVGTGATNVVLQVADGRLKLGAETGLQPAVLGDDLETRLANLEAAFNAHVHIGVTVGPGVTGAPQPSASPEIPIVDPPAIKAAKVEVI